MKNSKQINRQKFPAPFTVREICICSNNIPDERMAAANNAVHAIFNGTQNARIR